MKEFVQKGFCNLPDGLEGDVKVQRESCDVVYHLGSLDNDKNRKRKMNADANKIMLRRSKNPPKRATLDIIEAVVEEK